MIPRWESLEFAAVLCILPCAMLKFLSGLTLISPPNGLFGLYSIIAAAIEKGFNRGGSKCYIGAARAKAYSPGA